ncbi:MAG: hypothetical protein OXC07_03090 [Kistimonas sp.]|nr:hypothetical protein [Kistimonas sp.]
MDISEAQFETFIYVGEGSGADYAAGYRRGLNRHRYGERCVFWRT